MIFVADIQREVAWHFGLPLRVLREPDHYGLRVPSLSHPRQMAMMLSRRLTRKKYTEIGRLFKRDHSTVILGIRAARRRCLADRKNLEAMCEIRARVLGLVA